LWQPWVVVPEPACGDELADDEGVGVGELVLCADAIGTSQTAKATTMIAATKAADSLFIMVVLLGELTGQWWSYTRRRAAKGGRRLASR
jgi:hypothetical protein